MSKFLDSLCVTEISDKIWAVYDHPFRYDSDLAGLITVPTGFYTDFASVPRLGLLYAMLGDRAHQPAVIHDFLYATGTTTRSMADHVLYEAMTVIEIADWQRDLIYAGVRAGGWYAWEQHRKEGDLKVVPLP